MSTGRSIRVACFDWGGTLMSEDGPGEIPMGLWPQIQVIPGALACLATLHASRRIAIATNATVSNRPMIELALRRGGLLPYIDDIFCFTELGYRKDQVEFWTAVELRMRVPLSQMAMIGDSLEQDVYAPTRFGLHAVWFNEDGHVPEPTRSATTPMVTRLVDVPPMLLGRAST